MTSFSDLGLSPKTLAAVKRMGYIEPTPVQEQAIPLVLEGRDLVAAAQTGTGKTGAFTLPAMDRLQHAKGGTGPLMLVIAPTRELAQQTGEVAESIAASTHHRVVTVVGGLSYKPQIDKLGRGCDVLIATPGRLIDLMDQKAVNLSHVQVLVLDEADRMLDMGFLPSVKKIVAATPKDRQTLLFSATIDKSILSIVGEMLREPSTVEIAHKGDVADTIDHYIIRTSQQVKPDLLKALLAEKHFVRVIVFARTRSRADSTCRRLRRAGYKVEAIHSDRSQNQRRRALDKFANDEVNIICATDVLSRGIDVDMIDYVVNYDIPEQPEDYIHRIGRTGRAGNSGFAVSFVTPETEGALKDIEKLIKKRIPEMKLESFDLQEAQIEATEKAEAAKSSRDPEIRKVKRELASQKEQKERKREEALQASESAKRRSRKSKKRSSQAAALSQAPSAAPARANAKPRKQGSASTGKNAPSAASHRSGKGDFRPGRAHRAEVQRQRQSQSQRNRRRNGFRG